VTSVPDTTNSVGLSGIEVGPLNAVRVFDAQIVLPDEVVVSRHARKSRGPIIVPQWEERARTATLIGVLALGKWRRVRQAPSGPAGAVRRQRAVVAMGEAKAPSREAQVEPVSPSRFAKV
jgi:hypothetical protein